MRVEALRIGKNVRVAVYLADADNDRIPARNHPLAELENLWINMATGEIDDRPGPLDLQNRRLAQLAAALIGLFDEGRQHIGVAAYPLECPAQRGRGGFVSGGQQR